MKNTKRFIAVMLFVLLPLFCSITASADSGPKPSVKVSFEGLSDELCYATLLSANKSTGPASVWDGTEENARHNGNERYSRLPYGYEIWKAFVEYEDQDGFYFLQEIWQVNETKELDWNYYPPNPFKVLLYFPESGRFLVSDTYERYAFDSYFSVELTGNEGTAENGNIRLYRSYDYGREAVSLVVRIIITIAIELVIAGLFGYRKRRQWMILVGVNTATQIVLNVLLNVINYNSGHQAFAVNYIIFEFFVIIIEAVIFRLFLCEDCSDKKMGRRAAIYALVANVVSLIGGIWLAEWIPGVF